MGYDVLTGISSVKKLSTERGILCAGLVHLRGGVGEACSSMYII